jgi:anthranilate phosphoribosyltransferase
MAGVMAEIFAGRGDSVLVMRGEDGLDEFTTTAPTRVWAVAEGTVTEQLIDAADLGIPRSADGDLRGADAAFNAEVVRRLLAGQEGPVRDAVVLNAAAALAAHGRFGGSPDVAGSIKAGLDRATDSIDSGAAASVLERWIELARAIRAAE